MQQVGATALARRGPVHGGGAGAGRGAGLLLRAGQRGGRGGGAGGGAAARRHVLAGAAAVEGVPCAEPAQEADIDSEMPSHTAPVSAPHPVTAAGDAAGGPGAPTQPTPSRSGQLEPGEQQIHVQ